MQVVIMEIKISKEGGFTAIFVEIKNNGEASQ
jgi:hypothetical protein